MVKAKWNGAVLADAKNKNVIFKDGYNYFPPESVNMKYLKDNTYIIDCPTKGICNHFDILVNGKTEPNGAWTYKNPKKEAKEIKNYIAFANTVIIS